MPTNRRINYVILHPHEFKWIPTVSAINFHLPVELPVLVMHNSCLKHGHTLAITTSKGSIFSCYVQQKKQSLSLYLLHFAQWTNAASRWQPSKTNLHLSVIVGLVVRVVRRLTSPDWPSAPSSTSMAWCRLPVEANRTFNSSTCVNCDASSIKRQRTIFVRKENSKAQLLSVAKSYAEKKKISTN